jgi:hypothetical protein
MDSPFLEALVAERPHPSLGAHADTYGRLIGSWAGEALNYSDDGTVSINSIEAHFAWVLEGRAVQDVWITPSRKDRGPGISASLDFYGTTLRVFDSQSESWRVTWTDPVSGSQVELEGWRQGDDIVQLGTREGRPIRWVFSDIREDSLLWQGHILQTDGVTWRLEVEIRLQRR